MYQYRIICDKEPMFSMIFEEDQHERLKKALAELRADPVDPNEKYMVEVREVGDWKPVSVVPFE